MDIVSVVVLVLGVYGCVKGWKEISCGQGLCSSVKPSALKWINRRHWLSIIVKIFLTLVLAYVFLFYTCVMALLKFMSLIFRM